MFKKFYHTSVVAYGYKKLGMKLCKMVNPKNKKHFHPVTTVADFMPSVKSLTKVQNEPGKRGIRRKAVLNKLFMKQITDIMSTGTVAVDIIGRGIEISKVKVALDFRTVNVYWLSKGGASDAETEAQLLKLAGPLRHELSTLRVMGEVPYIVFVKDKEESLLRTLDDCLAKADYGEDFAPTEIGQLLKSEFTLDTKLSPEMKAKIKQLEDTTPCSEDPLPEMTHGVFGLDHAKIMNRLLAARKRSNDAWTALSKGDSNVISYTRSDSIENVDFSKQKLELAEFLKQRQILEKKINKELRDTRNAAANIQLTDDKDIDSDSDDVVYDDFDDYDYYVDDDDVTDIKNSVNKNYKVS